MTKDQMLAECRVERCNNNYEHVQKEIKAAMMQGEHCIYFGKESFKNNYKDDYVCLDETVKRLREDGFYVDDVSYDQWEISWED